jgi:hypothetical protein
VVPPFAFGKSARISHVKSPVPVIFSNEAAVEGKPEKLFGVLSLGSWSRSV